MMFSSKLKGLQQIIGVVKRLGIFCKRNIRKWFYVTFLLLCFYPFYILWYSRAIVPIWKVPFNREIINVDDKSSKNKGISKDFFEEANNNNHSLLSYDTSYIFAKDFNITDMQLKKLVTESDSYCDAKFVGFAHLYAELTDVLLDPTKNYNRQGGEEIVQVKNQPENAEYLTLDKGYFKLLYSNCTKKINYTFNHREPNTLWLNSLKCSWTNGNFKETVTHDFVIAVQRYEYVNVYHTMTDWYNTFLMAVLFKQNPKNITILWMDAHPKGSLDTVWRTLFRSTIRASNINRALVFRKLIWSINGYNSFINKHSLSSVPYLEEFRSFFLQQSNISTNRKKDCKCLHIVFSWRHDYVAHPRNMKGLIKRQIANEDELEQKTKEYFPDHKIAGTQLDSLSFQEQLNIIVNSDILIGMHGAGMAMSIFLPRHAGVIELYPSYFSTNNVHFMSIAKWRGLKYKRWQNKNSANEHKDFHTYIQPKIIIDLISQIQNSICHTLTQ